jgi:hypothetical protein
MIHHVQRCAFPGTYETNCINIGVDIGVDPVRRGRGDEMRRRTLLVTMTAFVILIAGSGVLLRGQAPAAQPAATAERTAWYFYKVKWGHQDEFVDLFRRNHLPVLKDQIPARITSVKTYVPTYHGDGRADWTFAVEITFRDAAAMTGPSPDEAIQRRLFPDRAKFLKEEQRRFEILDAHWDVPLNLLSVDRQ